VTGEVLDVRKDKKVLVFKKRRRQNYRRKKGHRQWIAVISVAEILKPGSKSKLSAKSKAAKTDAPKAEAKAEKPAAKAAPKTETPKAEAPKAAAKASDDLTQLSGVGPAFAKKLNEAGVTGFAQIAGWSEAEIDRLDGEISGLKTKAEKGDWVAEAKKLAGE
jgi:large subunit ribosomal protein L21